MPGSIWQWRSAFFSLLSVVLLSACLTPAATTKPFTAITNVTVIDAVNNVRNRQTVIFSGDEIVAVQSAARKVNAKTTNLIDGSDKFLIPGLWDFHVHLTYDKRFTETMPALFLSWGITSVRDTGGLLNEVSAVVADMRYGLGVAPRVFFAGPLLDGQFVVYDGNSIPEIGVRNATPNEARAMIADLKTRGVDFIKIYELVAPEVFQAMVDEAAKQALPIDAHIPLSMLARVAGPQLDSIEHLRNIELDCAQNAEELLSRRLDMLKNPDQLSGAALRSSLHNRQRLAAIANYSETRCDETLEALQSTLQVPTLRLNTRPAFPPYARPDWRDALERVPAAVRLEWNQAEDITAQNRASVDTRFADWSLFLVKKMQEKGIPIAAGTDTPIGLSIPGYSLHSELEMLVRAGLSPLEALRAATMTPAQYFSLQDRSGSIDVGKQADMVLLDKNPLDDISNTKSIATVISAGRVLQMGELIAAIRR